METDKQTNIIFYNDSIDRNTHKITTICGDIKEQGNKTLDIETYNTATSKTKMKLGKFDDGDQYEFEINTYIEGLISKIQSTGGNYGGSITIKGRGLHELRTISTICKEISSFIDKNTNLIEM